MNIRRLAIPQSQLQDRVLPELRDRVFHVTTPRAFDAIFADGFIRVRPGNVEPSYPNSYFLAQNCVSLCDLRFLSAEQLEDARWKYNFLDYRSYDRIDPVFLFLTSGSYPALRIWGPDLAAQSRGFQLVPYLESGHPGDIAISSISDVLHVTVERPPDSPFVAAHRALNDRHATP
jgi:hypothetical protein